MPINQILELLVAERDRLNAAIQVLGGTGVSRVSKSARGSNSGRTTSKPASVRPVRTLSAEGRQAIAEAARKRWAAIKAGKAPSPFAKKKAGV
jgi:hypothetical protein